MKPGPSGPSLTRRIIPRVYGMLGRYRKLELSLWRRKTMQGRRVGRKRNAPTHRFAFSGWHTDCLRLFGRNPQPSRTLCPTFFNSFSTCLPSLFLYPQQSPPNSSNSPSPGKPRRSRRPPSRPPSANP